MDLSALMGGNAMDVIAKTTYNSASSPNLRGKLIMQNSDVKNAAVAEKFGALDYDELVAFRAAGTQPSKDPRFDQQWDRLDKIIKTNPKVAEDMVRQFKSQPGNYAAAMDDLASNFEANPQFAETMLKRLEKNPESAGTEFSQYRAHFNSRKVQSYIDKTMKGGSAADLAPSPAGPAPQAGTQEKPDAAAVAAGATGADAATSQVTKTPRAGKPGTRAAQTDRAAELAKREAGKADRAVVAPVAAAAADDEKQVAATTRGGTVDQTVIDEMSPEAAKREYQRFSADPKNKDFMAMLKQNQLEEGMEDVIAKYPDRVNGLFSPGTMKKYSSLLKDGKKAEFLAEFTGETDKKSMNPADMMQGLGGVIDGAAIQHPWLKDVKRSVMSGLGFATDSIYSISGALQGSGRSLKDMLNEPTNAAELRKAGITPRSAYDEQSLTDLARDAQENLRARKTAPDGPNSVALSRHGMKMLGEDFGVDHKGMQALLDGSATIHHVDIVEEKNKTTGKMEKRAVARLEPFVPQRAAAAPAAEPSTPAPQRATADATPGSGATAYPVEDRRPHVVPRELTQAPAAPRPVPSGETTS